MSSPENSTNASSMNTDDLNPTPFQTPHTVSHLGNGDHLNSSNFQNNSQNFHMLISGLWNTIPDFSGAPSDDVTLEEFLDHIKELSSQVTCTDSNRLFILKRKLKGEAKSMILDNPN